MARSPSTKRAADEAAAAAPGVAEAEKKRKLDAPPAAAAAAADDAAPPAPAAEADEHDEASPTQPKATQVVASPAKADAAAEPEAPCSSQQAAADAVELTTGAGNPVAAPCQASWDRAHDVLTAADELSRLCLPADDDPALLPTGIAWPLVRFVTEDGSVAQALVDPKVSGTAASPTAAALEA